MENKKFLNEETYQKTKKKVIIVAIIVLIVGILIGGSLIATGLKKQNKVNSNYSEESKQSLQEKITIEKQKLETKKSKLESKGIKYDLFAKYSDGESYDLKIITQVLDPSFDYCAFDEYKNNSLTSTYCSYSQQLADFTDFNKNFDSFGSIPFYMIGGFVILASCMIAGSIYLIAKRREIAAFSAQQIIPVAKEKIDTMAPTIGGAMGTIGKELAKGIKDGINEADENK